MSYPIYDSSRTVITRSMDARTRRIIARSQRVVSDSCVRTQQSLVKEIAHKVEEHEPQDDVIDAPNLLNTTMAEERHPLRVSGVFFTPYQAPGDFTRLMREEWLYNPPAILPKEFPIFNDNLECWTNAFLYPDLAQQSGGGNAAIRCYEFLGLTRGIPTGTNGRGFSSLDQQCQVDPRVAMEVLMLDQTPSFASLTVRQIIDAACEKIVQLLVLARSDVENVHYSCGFTSLEVTDDAGLTHRVPHLGTGIFRVSDDVIEYITLKLHHIEKLVNLKRHSSTP